MNIRKTLFIYSTIAYLHLAYGRIYLGYFTKLKSVLSNKSGTTTCGHGSRTTGHKLPTVNPCKARLT